MVLTFLTMFSTPIGSGIDTAQSRSRDQNVFCSELESETDQRAWKGEFRAFQATKCIFHWHRRRELDHCSESRLWLYRRPVELGSHLLCELVMFLGPEFADSRMLYDEGALYDWNLYGVL